MSGLPNLVKLIQEPSYYFDLFEDFPESVKIETKTRAEYYDFIHLFCENSASMETHGKKVKEQLKKTGLLWVSWLKGSAGIKTDINRESVRSYFLDLGLVDVKVCSVNAKWSGLKFVYRLKDRN